MRLFVATRWIRIGRAFSPWAVALSGPRALPWAGMGARRWRLSGSICTQGFALGWYRSAPLALEAIRRGVDFWRASQLRLFLKLTHYLLFPTPYSLFSGLLPKSRRLRRTTSRSPSAHAIERCLISHNRLQRLIRNLRQRQQMPIYRQHRSLVNSRILGKFDRSTHLILHRLRCRAGFDGSGIEPSLRHRTLQRLI